MQEEWQLLVHLTRCMSCISFLSHESIVQELVQRSLFLHELTIVQVVNSWKDSVEEAFPLVLFNGVLQSKLLFFGRLSAPSRGTARLVWWDTAKRAAAS